MTTTATSPRWASVCTNCSREAELESRPTHGQRALCDDCASKPYHTPGAGGLDAPPASSNGTKSTSMSKLIDGGAFVLDAPTHVPSVWGAGTEVLWAQGEPLMICGPQGVGKSTIAQQLVLSRLGVLDLYVLGYPVTAADPGRRVLYIAADRPNQIARSMRRMVRPRDRQALIDGLTVWRGPLPFDITQDPGKLLSMAAACGAGTVVIDSLKDVAMPLIDDRVGSAVNRALQLMIAEGIEVLTLHHQRKGTADNKKPAKLQDVYGSVWITAGHGSIAVLWGEPGDPVIELIHVKQPADQVGPLELTHDHAAGVTQVHERPTARALIAAATNGGITVADAATRLYGPNPDRNAVQKARRKLDDLVRQGIAVKVEGETPKAPVHYHPAGTPVIDRDSPRDRSRSDHAESETPATTASRADHGLSRTGIKHGAPPFKGARDAQREATPDEQADYERALALVEEDEAA